MRVRYSDNITSVLVVLYHCVRSEECVARKDCKRNARDIPIYSVCACIQYNILW